MNIKKRIVLKRAGMLVIVVSLIVSLIAISGVYAQESFYGGSPTGFSGGLRVYGTSVNPQFNNPSFLGGSVFTSPEIYWPQFNRGDCLERQDLVMQIAPGGCSPAVVRSDLLEEQNVPVFCKVMAIQVNPLIDISRIRSLHFKGDYPKGVSSISYFPANAAVRSQTQLVSSPIKDNLGYLVVVLSSAEYKGVEANMPDFLEGNVTATIDYDVENAFGIGKTNFYVNEMDDEEWLRDYRNYNFWNGKGYIRADSIEEDQAVISVYRDLDTRQATVTLRKGETSKDIYLSGFYCAAGMKIKLDEIGVPVESALMQINDQQVWVSRGDKIIDNRCTIRALDAFAGGGKISVSCSIKDGKFDLSLIPGKVNLSASGQSGKEYSINSKIKEDIFLGYAGEYTNGESFVVLVNDTFSDNEVEFSDKDVFSIVEKVMNDKILNLEEEIETAVEKQYKRKLTRLKKDAIEKGVGIKILFAGQEGYGVRLNEILIAKDVNWDEAGEKEKLAKKYYDDTIEYYQDLVDFFPNEKRIEEADPYAALGLYGAAKLSTKFGMNEKAQEFFDRLIKDYPDSDITNKAKRDKDLLMKYDSSDSKAIVLINNREYFIELLDFKKPTREELSAVFLINGKEETLGLNEIKKIGEEEGKEGGKESSIRVEKISEDSVVVKYAKPGVDIFGSKTQTKTLQIKEPYSFDDVDIKLLEINLKKQVKLTITPKSFGPRTESDFKFKIGIEKRAIELSPDRTRSMIDNLDKKIKDWSEINEKLGKVVKALKGACFATAGMLTVKNLFSGLSGKSMARTEVMTKSGGWNDFCEREAGQGNFGGSVQKCLLENNPEIERDIEIYSEQIKKTNEILEGIQEAAGVKKTDILDFETQTNYKEVEDEFKEEFGKFCSDASGDVELPDKSETPVSYDQICDWNTLTHDQRRDFMTWYNVRQQGGSEQLTKVINGELGRTALNARDIWEYEGARIAAADHSQQYNLGVRALTPVGDPAAYGDIKAVTETESLNHDIYKNFERGQKVVRVFIPVSKSFKGAETFKSVSEVAGKEVIVAVADDDKDGIYTPKGKIYHIEKKSEIVDTDSETEKDAYDSVTEYMSLAGLDKIKEADLEAYKNPMIDPDKLLVKYFERAPYKELPAEVPFDVLEGWYVKMTYVLSGFGKPYDESGRAINYYICNVGPNGRIEFKQGIDDICRYYNGQISELGFPGMGAGESRTLVNRAQQAIAEAARQHGQKTVRIGKNTFKSGISFGGDEGRCSDFMSPSDCHVMFNVCDPVICPTSRCDLGGNFPVDNVIQTGIIGGLMLCLPNAQEGIAIPVCLSGVHAGIDGLLSIYKSVQDCLEDSLETGKNIGFCDEVKSIYLCEFFWKESTPFLKVLVPRLIESFFSQGVRGGGEYLTVQSAWDNTQSAIDYFRNEYAVNSMKAFTDRSTENLGSEVCKSFMSVRYPNSADFFNNLIEPDSPVQYSAWFSENILTTATVPSTSHYKVYYHIYAGNDRGSYYAVYLKDLPESSFVFTSGTYVVNRGYIARGGQVDEARDFTAVSGYKQLCVSINGQEECGFGKVSTSYALNYLSDIYATDQAKAVDVKTESECVVGRPSLGSLINPNLQAGVSEVVNPELYNRGIIRVCASENPGKRVLASGEYDTTKTTYDRWKDVGYCEDPTIRCWLDEDSVKNVIKDKNLTKEVLDQVNLNAIGADGFWDENQSVSVAGWAENFIDDLEKGKSDQAKGVLNSLEKTDDVNKIDKIVEVVSELEKLTNLGLTNTHRARGLYLLGRLYKLVAETILPEPVKQTSDLTQTEEPLGDGIEWSEFGFTKNGVDHIRYYKDGGEVESEVLWFSYALQQVTLADKIKYKFLKDEEGRVILEKIGTDEDFLKGGEIPEEDLWENFFYTRDDKKYIKYFDGLDDKEREVKDFDSETKIVTLLDGTKRKAVIEEYLFKKKIVFEPLDDLKRGVRIRIDDVNWRGVLVSQILYSYTSGEKWLSDDKEFVDMELGYEEGIRYLVKRSNTGDKFIIGDKEILNVPIETSGAMAEKVLEVLRGLDDKEIESSKEDSVFEFQDGINDVNLFYSYSKDGWKWSTDEKGEGVSVNDAERAVIYQHFSDNTKALLKNLIGKDFEQGVDLLRIRTVRNDEGGWFSNTALRVIINDKDKLYPYNSGRLETLDKFILDLDYLSQGIIE